MKQLGTTYLGFIAHVGYHSLLFVGAYCRWHGRSSLVVASIKIVVLITTTSAATATSKSATSFSRKSAIELAAFLELTWFFFRLR